MKIPFPDWEMARLALEGYAEDGVDGMIGYDPETASWIADLNEEQHREYLSNITRRRDEVIDGFCSVDWRESTNIQGQELEPPAENENRLSLYILDYQCRTARAFKVTGTLANLLDRATRTLFIGTTCESCKKKVMVIIGWEDLKPKKED